MPRFTLANILKNPNAVHIINGVVQQFHLTGEILAVQPFVEEEPIVDNIGALEELYNNIHEEVFVIVHPCLQQEEQIGNTEQKEQLNEIFEEPVQDEQVNEPINNTVQEPVQDEQVNEPINNTVQEPVQDEQVNEPINNAVQEPVQEEQVNEPIEEPINNTVQDEPIREESVIGEQVNEPINNTVQEPVNDQTKKTQSKKSKKNQSR